jgi:hypothetical protein
VSKNKSEFELAAGKLISAIQKEWLEESGESTFEFSHDVMDAAHRLLQCRTPELAKQLLGARSVEQFLGEVWIRRHQSVASEVGRLQRAIDSDTYS